MPITASQDLCSADVYALQWAHQTLRALTAQHAPTCPCDLCHAALLATPHERIHNVRLARTDEPVLVPS